MTHEQVLALDDIALADLYSTWSEDHYAAGWLVDSFIPEFISDVLSGDARYLPGEITNYQRETLAEIRRMLREQSKEPA